MSRQKRGRHDQESDCDPEVNLRELYPAHYTRFHCIASSCDFTCCREWKIYADDAVFRKWQKNGIRKVTRRADGQRVVRLTEDLNCPHLAEDGLCRLITEYGEGLIPGSGRACPREIREYPDRTERSLMLACPAVIDLLAEGFSVPLTGNPEESGRKTEAKDKEKAGESAGGPEALRKLPGGAGRCAERRGSTTVRRSHGELQGRGILPKILERRNGCGPGGREPGEHDSLEDSQRYHHELYSE